MPEIEVALVHNYLIVGALLFCIGLIGFLARRNLIVMFLSIEMMLQGISISLVAWGRYHDNWGGQVLVLFIISVAACEAAIALALILMLFRRAGNLDVAAWHALREDNLPAYADLEIPEDIQPKPSWPVLTPAGIEPMPDDDSLVHRSHV